MDLQLKTSDLVTSTSLLKEHLVAQEDKYARGHLARVRGHRLNQMHPNRLLVAPVSRQEGHAHLPAELDRLPLQAVPIHGG